MFSSLIVSAWNRLELLVPFFNSLWANTTSPYELIVHDDGSQDETSDWLYKQLKKGKISTLITNPPGHNRGHGTSVNRAANIAEGDYIMKLNGDETFAPGWLEACIRAMEMFPEIGMLHAAHYYKSASRSLPISKLEWDLEPYTLKKMDRNGVKIRTVWVGPGNAFMVSKKTWYEKGPWIARKNPAFSEDMEYRIRICPMMRLLEISHSKTHPPPTDLAAHWEQYKDTPWLAVLDPPMVSYHPGRGLCSIGAAQVTLKDGPLIFGG